MSSITAPTAAKPTRCSASFIYIGVTTATSSTKTAGASSIKANAASTTNSSYSADVVLLTRLSSCSTASCSNRVSIRITSIPSFISWLSFGTASISASATATILTCSSTVFI